MNLKYRVGVEDVVESLYCINWRHEGKRKQIHIWILNLLGIFCLIRIYREPSNIVSIFLMVLIIILQFFLGYGSKMRYGQKAKGILKRGTEYEITFPLEGITKIYESNRVITICREQEFYCIPTRVLNQKEMEYIKNHVFCEQNNRLQIQIS